MLKITTSLPLVVGNASTEFLQSSDVFRLKNDNIKELESHRMASGKMAKPKADVSSSGAKVLSDMKIIQSNNKLNNNTIEMQQDDVHAMDKIELKTTKPKNAVAAAAAVAPTTIGTAAISAAKLAIDAKATQKSNSGSNLCDVANKSNNNLTNIATAPKNLAKESTKKKGKEKDQKATEEKRRQQEEDEERKRLELIAAQRKAKLVDQNAVRSEQGQKRNNLAASVGKFASQFLMRFIFAYHITSSYNSIRLC